MKMTPVNDLNYMNGRWYSTGHDPHFLIEGVTLRGWNRLTFHYNSPEHIPLKLYWDSGKGFSEEQSFIFSEIPQGEGVHTTYLFIPPNSKRLRLDPGEKEIDFVFEELKVKKTTKYNIALSSLKKYLSQKGLKMGKEVLIKSYRVWKNEGAKSLWLRIKQQSGINADGNAIDDYNVWIMRNSLTANRISEIKKQISQFKYKPLISVVVPVYNVEETWLRKCIDSVIDQLYPNWELCIADDSSTKPHIKMVLEEYRNKDQRIKVVYRQENGHISRTSNSGIALAKGEFIALLDHDDELTKDALYENVLLLNSFPDADIIYSDEDKISPNGDRHSPFFKPDWSPDLLMSQMYTCHLTLYRKTLIDKVGGFRVGFEGSQDFDLMLRVSELTDRIYHIPKILYHWRAIPSSTASSSGSKNYTHMAGLRALEETITRRKLSAKVESVENYNNVYLVRYMPQGQPKISIIIPNRNLADTLNSCLKSIFEKTVYSNYEVIVIDNGSNEGSVFEVYEQWKLKEPTRFRMYSLDIPFNYSRLNNFGVTKASGKLLLFLNNDVEVISEDWLDEMAGQAIRPEVGAVGACLYYPDGTIQHAGVVLGVGGIAGHGHSHFPAEHPGYFCRLKVVSNYTAVTAACLMIRKEIFEEVNGLEEELQVAFNDVDFCLKVWQAGYNNVWLPHVKLYHFESKSRGYEDTPEKQKRFLGEVEWMKQRWLELLENDPCYNPNLTKERGDFSINKFNSKDMICTRSIVRQNSGGKKSPVLIES